MPDRAEQQKKREPQPPPPAPAKKAPEEAPNAGRGGGVRLWKSELTLAPTPVGTASEVGKTSVLNGTDTPVTVVRVVDLSGAFPDELRLDGLEKNARIGPGGKLVLDFRYVPKLAGPYSKDLRVHFKSGGVLDLRIKGSTGASIDSRKRRGKSKEDNDAKFVDVTRLSSHLGNLNGARRDGVDIAYASIDEAKEEATSREAELLTMAATYAVTAAAGSIAALVASKVVSFAGASLAKGAGDIVKKAIKDVYSASNGRSKALPHSRLKQEFMRVHDELIAETTAEAIDAFFDRVKPAIDSVEALEALKLGLTHAAKPAIGIQERATMAAWTNFIAQYHHDVGASAGAVSPDEMRSKGLLKNKQRFLLAKRSGLLEVDFGFRFQEAEDGRVIAGEPWRVALTGLGKNVHDTIRKFGTFGNAPLNRVIRGYWIDHTRLSTPVPAITVLVAPDDTITAVNRQQEAISSVSTSRGRPSPPPITGEQLFMQARFASLEDLK